MDLGPSFFALGLLYGMHQECNTLRVCQGKEETWLQSFLPDPPTVPLQEVKLV